MLRQDRLYGDLGNNEFSSLSCNVAMLCSLIRCVLRSAHAPLVLSHSGVDHVKMEYRNSISKIVHRKDRCQARVQAGFSRIYHDLSRSSRPGNRPLEVRPSILKFLLQCHSRPLMSERKGNWPKQEASRNELS